jgi:pimeloyl-ACP methyl ester carboxylesterase
MAADPRDLIAALGLKQVVIAGWSLGGLVAQVVAVERHPGITHAVLIGTGPPGPMIKRSEQIFFDTAAIEHNSFEDEVVLFFEPKSQASRAEAQRSSARIAARRAQLSKPVPIDFARSHLGSEPREAIFPSDAVLAALKETTIPILHVGGDHDIVFPIENWYALNPHLPTLRLLTYPSAGHGPHHQHPEETARHIAAFVHTRDRQLKQEELQP